jgi:hypothetical protein
MPRGKVTSLYQLQRYRRWSHNTSYIVYGHMETRAHCLSQFHKTKEMLRNILDIAPNSRPKYSKGRINVPARWRSETVGEVAKC